MFERGVEGLEPEGVLAELEQCAAVEQAAAAHRLRLAAQWADLHPGLERDGPVLPGSERVRHLGGPGTPGVAEFAAAELGAGLETSTHAAEQLLADALDLRHRLPRLWERVQAGQVKAWVARRCAQLTHPYCLQHARVIDATIAPWADRLSLSRLESLILATWTRLDPAGAEHLDRLARHELGVWLSPKHERGVGSLFARMELVDALRMDAAVQRGADALEALGDTRLLGARRAAALGVLADPQDALDLYTAHADAITAAGGDPGEARFAHHEQPRDVDPELETDAQRAERPRDPQRDEVDDGQPRVAVHPSLWRRRHRFDTGPKVTLYVHLTDQTLATGQGVARVEDVGPLTAGLVREWLTGAGTVKVVPVIDLNDQVPVDAYEIPDRLADAVRLRSPVDCFPYSTSTSRRMDLDHTEPYVSPDDGGPPGQTRSDNLAPLTRKHHRIKTHAKGWAVRQVYNGVLVWRSPHGRYYLVDHTGTTRAIPA